MSLQYHNILKMRRARELNVVSNISKNVQGAKQKETLYMPVLMMERLAAK